jgi:hypothetical protein
VYTQQQQQAAAAAAAAAVYGMQYYCSIRREGAVVAAVFRPVVFYMLFFKFIAEPYKFLTTKNKWIQ